MMGVLIVVIVFPFIIITNKNSIILEERPLKTTNQFHLMV